MVNDYRVVVAGVRAGLRRFPDRVEPVDQRLLGVADVALLDTFGSLAGTDGAVARIVARHRTRLVVLGDKVDPGTIERCLRAGAAGYVSKRTGLEQLVHALELTGRGRRVVDVPARRMPTALPPVWPGIEYGLTVREAETVVLLVRGLTNQQVADRFRLRAGSVRKYLWSAYRKIGVSTRSQAVLWGLDHGFAPLDSAL